MRILNVEVPAPLLATWRSWLAPPLQPFFVPTSEIHELPASIPAEMTPELRDTYRAYNMDRCLRAVWLTESAFASLGRQARARVVRAQAIRGRGAVPTVRRWEDLLDPGALRAQGDGHRFVWWPSLLARDVAAIFARVISEDRRPSRHDEVSESTWARCATVLAAARQIAGTFPSGSGPNCFGTVMAAAGEPGAVDAWMLQAPFEEWLSVRTRPGGDDDAPGTVLIWRDGGGAARHAAVTIGDGWGLEKPSQDWHSPRGVSAVRELIKANRTQGLRLHRRRIRTAVPVQ